MTDKLIMERSKPQSNKWETLTEMKYPESLDELNKALERFKGKIEVLAEKHPNTEYRIATREIHKVIE